MPIEIEIKSLLGGAARADALRAALIGRGAALTETSAQLNHYFTGDALPSLAAYMNGVLAETDVSALRGLVGRARKSSVRTRLLNQTVLLIVKAALDDTTSANGITRLEYEAEAHDHTFDQLNALVVGAGYAVQAKWSRRRETYRLGDVSISLDKNAGYGYLAEFEVMAEDEADAPALTHRLRALMAELGAQELAQDRLERMFAHYNAHWQTYYGTDDTFTVE